MSLVFLEMCKYSTFKNKNKKNEDENDINKKYKTDFDIAESIDNNYNRMLKDKKEDKSIIIPPGFNEQVKSQDYFELLQAILDYCRELFRLESKQKSLEIEAKQRGLPVPQVLPSEKRKLHEKAKKMSLKYSVILFRRKAEAAQPGLSLTHYMRLKSQAVGNQKADKQFYETIILFTGKVLQSAFDKSDIPKLEEELNRLFRTNAFNISQRTQAEEKRFKKYPQLRPPQKKETADEMIHRYAMKARVPNENYNRQSYLRQKTEIRPLFSNLTPHGARNSRSPLVSLIFPSMKDKIRVFEEENKKRNESKGNNRSMVVKPSELDQIIEEETRKKKKKHLNQSVADYL
jgi:protein phosphatase 1 regulatory subunit 36